MQALYYRFANTMYLKIQKNDVIGRNDLLWNDISNLIEFPQRSTNWTTSMLNKYMHGWFDSRCLVFYPKYLELSKHFLYNKHTFIVVFRNCKKNFVQIYFSQWNIKQSLIVSLTHRIIKHEKVELQREQNFFLHTNYIDISLWRLQITPQR